MEAQQKGVPGSTPHTKEHEPRDGYTRVSDISSLFTDFSAIPKDILNAAAMRGTDVHKLCIARALHMDLLEVPSEYLGYVESFREWFDNDVSSVLLAEHRLYCDVHSITGQVDLVVTLHGSDEPVLVDLKTPERRYLSWDLQMGGYAYLLRESTETIWVKQALLVRLDKDGSYPKVDTVASLSLAEQTFFNALSCYRYLKLKGKKDVE